MIDCWYNIMSWNSNPVRFFTNLRVILCALSLVMLNHLLVCYFNWASFEICEGSYHDGMKSIFLCGLFSFAFFNVSMFLVLLIVDLYQRTLSLITCQAHRLHVYILLGFLVLLWKQTSQKMMKWCVQWHSWQHWYVVAIAFS